MSMSEEQKQSNDYGNGGGAHSNKGGIIYGDKMEVRWQIPKTGSVLCHNKKTNRLNLRK